MTDTPSASESVLIAPSRFAGPAGFTTGTHVALDGSGKIDARTLVESAVMAALLSLEQAGALTLVREAKTELLGLHKTHAVLAGRVHGGPPPAAGTSEAGLLAAVPEVPIEVDRVVAHWLVVDMYDPDAVVLERIRDGLVRRGLVERTEIKTKTWIFTRTTVAFTLTDAARAADIEALHALVADAGGRPEFAATLRTEVRQGLTARTEKEKRGAMD